jgi:hypothetical protein
MHASDQPETVGPQVATAPGADGEAEDRADPKSNRGSEPSPLFVTILAIGTSAIAAVNEFTNAFQFEPFWVDVGFALAALGVALYLLRSMISGAKADGSTQGRRRLQMNLDPVRAAMGIILLVIFSLSIGRPIRNAVAGDWTVCGTFVSACEKNSCIRLFDEKGRKSMEECLPLDDTGYLALHSEARWRYQPVKMSLVCGADESIPIPLNDAMIRNAACSGEQDFR